MKAGVTWYAVPGWGVGELWRSGDVVLAHDFRFDGAHAVSDTESDTGSDALITRFHAFLRGEDVCFADVALDLGWATPLQRAIVEALRAVPRGDVVSYDSPVPTFADVPASNPFYGWIERLYEQGITTGCSPGPPRLYCPNDFVPRQQMAAFLIRAFAP